jgi:hypothetical protein
LPRGSKRLTRRAIDEVPAARLSVAMRKSSVVAKSKSSLVAR